MPKSNSAFHVWLHRMGAMRCRAAVVKCGGNLRDAARQIGVDHTTLWKILQRDNAMLDARAAAENWNPPEAEVIAPRSCAPPRPRASEPACPTANREPREPLQPTPGA